MNKTRILYIEDYPVIQQVYVDVLRKHGFEVDLASDGKQAAERVKADGYDVLLVDLLLPQVSGLEFLQQYVGSHQGGIIIVLTDFDNPKTMAEVKALGIENYWMKVDHTPYVLAEKIDKLLKERAANKSEETK